MSGFEYELVKPDFIDEYFGQVKKITRLIYRCFNCGEESSNFMEVNSVMWDNSSNKFCSYACADMWADYMYASGIHPIPFGEYERINFVLDAKFKKAYDCQVLTKDEQLEVSFWLRNIFRQYDAVMSLKNETWKIDASDKHYYETFLQKLKQGIAFDLHIEANVISFNNALTGLLMWNGISLRQELREEYKQSNELQECGCPLFEVGHQAGCGEEVSK